MISRAAVIDRFLNDSCGNPTWSSMDKFEKDNLQEVDAKIHSIDNNIWGKLIVMEKGVRTAKAYLRCENVVIDGSDHEFDGFRIGLRRFRNVRRESNTETHLKLLGQGLEISIDFLGNVYLVNRTGRRLTVDGQENLHIFGSRKEKIFDLRRFKHDLDLYENAAKRKAMVKIQVGSSPRGLDCSLWICIIHVIAVEMASLISSGSGSSSNRSSNSLETMSIPKFRAPKPPSPEHHYEICARSSQRSSEESGYSMPEGRHTSTHSSPSGSSNSHSPNGPIPPIDARMSRFAQFEKEPRKPRNGVRRRMDKSAGPVLVRSQLHDSRTNLTNTAPLSSSIIDLRTLNNLRKPVYSQKPLVLRRNHR